MVPRSYLRCFRCLDISVVEGPVDLSRGCFCGGGLESMGPVTDDRAPMVKREHSRLRALPPTPSVSGPDERLPKCDASCRSARGPSCSCPCGGENHGCNLLLTEDVLPPALEAKRAALLERTEKWWAAAGALRLELLERASAVHGLRDGFDSYWVARGLSDFAARLQIGSAPATWAARDRLLVEARAALSASFPPSTPDGVSSHA